MDSSLIDHCFLGLFGLGLLCVAIGTSQANPYLRRGEKPRLQVPPSLWLALVAGVVIGCAVRGIR